MRSAKRPPDPATAGPKKTFLVVLTPVGRELWDSAAFRPHPTGDGTLQVQRAHQPEMVAMYSQHGWLKYSWEQHYPADVADLRVDGRLPF